MKRVLLKSLLFGVNRFIKSSTKVVREAINFVESDVMKKLLPILILIFTLQTPSQADDIRDFQIEGISIGDSLLDYMSEDEIINNDLKIYQNNSKFLVIDFNGKKNIYDYIYLYVKRNDNKYIIYTIRAINIVDNKNQCLKIKNEIVMYMKPLFKNADFQEDSQKHFVYKDSIQYISQFSFGDDARVADHARVECLILGKEDKKNYEHSLEVIVQSAEFGQWLETQ